MEKEVETLSIAEGTIVFDGLVYSKGDEIPDLGSFVATSADGNIRNYEGLSADIDKLPRYDSLGTGSSAFCLDTGQLFKYERTTRTWYEI